MTPAEEDTLLSDLAEAERHVRQTLARVGWPNNTDRAYVARLLRHALELVEK